MPERPHRAGRPLIGIAALIVAAALLSVGFALGSGIAVGIANRSSVASAPVAKPATPSAETTVARPAAAATAATAPRSQVPSKPATMAPPAPKPVAKPRVIKPAGPSVDAYRGLGSWVDIYDERAWRNPSSAVRDMASHGVRTLYIETSNSRSSFAIKDPGKMQAFIREAHAHKMKVVAWYLPDLSDQAKDYNRVAEAIRFRTSDGQRFDSFALDIESSKVKPVSARNRALENVSRKIRKLVGPSYPLGAITPAPAAIAKKGSSWTDFPYAMVAGYYDVFVPMSYYTWHERGPAAVRADTLANMRVLRAQKGCAKKPVHLIGGIAEESTGAELWSFVRAGLDTHALGASLYSWDGTGAKHWQELKAVK